MNNDFEKDIFPVELVDDLAEKGILAVVTVDRVDDAVPLARALVAGGVTAIELAWRTPATMGVLRAIRENVPGTLAGIGTILTVDQLRDCQAAGAAFGVSPGLDPALLTAARELRFPYAPGVMTPSEVQVAIGHGCRFLKYFPAETVGGLKHLRSMNAPFAHLNLRYVVLGGLTESNAANYLEEPSVAVLGGSWIAPRNLIRNGDWDEIRRRAYSARSLVHVKCAEAPVATV